MESADSGQGTSIPLRRAATSPENGKDSSEQLQKNNCKQQ